MITSDNPEKDNIKAGIFGECIVVSPSVTYGVSIEGDCDVIFGYY
jgi:hypothetical protein